VSDVPPVGTQLGDLQLEEVFLGYDGPKLFSCRNKTGQWFIAVFVDEDGNSEIYLYMPISFDRLRAVRSGQVTLRMAFSNPEDGIAYSVRRYLDRPKCDVELVTADGIPEDWLPEETAVLGLPTPTAETFSPRSLAEESVRTLRPLAAFELRTSDTRTEYPLRSLGAFMQLVQDNVEAFAQEVEGRQTSAGPVQQDIVAATELAFTEVRAASFVLVVAPRMSGRLFHLPLVVQALNRMRETIAAVEDDELLRGQIAQLKSRALSKYRDLLEEVEDSTSGLAMFVTDTRGGIYSASLDDRQVKRTLDIVRTTAAQPARTLEIEAVLIGVNVRTFVFELFNEVDNKKYAGKAIDQARRQVLGLTTGNRYRATLLEEIEIVPVTGELKSKYRLTHIVELG
jgi:hypothetical protein